MIAKKIFKNTMMLYARQILLLLVGFYTIRVVLDALGVEDFGIYSLVAGFVALCSFLSNSMTSVTQRFFSYALGKSDKYLLKSTFSVSIAIYVGIVVFVLVILSGPGLWYVQNNLSIPETRFDATLLLYQYSVVTFVFTILSAPFLALIIAHEDMHYFALVSVVEAISRLVLVTFLVAMSGDKLELYGVMQLLISTAIFSVYFFICKIKYAECQFRKYYWSYKLFKDMCSFTGWTLFGQITTITRVQLITILLNQFFNPTVVAARAIATAISSKVNIFSSNFNTGMYPGIVKSYSSNSRDVLIPLVLNGSKLTFFLMWVLVLPLLIEMDSVLNFWLTEVPSQATLFTKLALIESLILSISLPLTTVARATGNIKRYEVYLGTLQLLIFVISFIILKAGQPSESVFIVAIFINIIMFFLRLYLVSKMIDIKQGLFYSQVCLPMTVVAFISGSFSWLISFHMPNGLVFTMISAMSSVAITTTTMYFFGLDKVWRKKIRDFVQQKLISRGGFQ